MAQQNLNDPNSLLQLLLASAQGDPAGNFIQQAFLAGRMPGDPGVNYNTVLNFLDPNRVVERQEELFGPGSLVERFGLTQGEEADALRQMIGLQLGPGQEALIGAQQNTALANIIKALADQSTAAARTKEAGVKEREATLAEQELPSKIAERTGAGAANQALAAAREVDTRLKSLISNPKAPDADRRAAREALSRSLQDPTSMSILYKMLQSDDSELNRLGAELFSEQTGFDLEYTQSFWEKILGREGTVPKLTPPAETPKETPEAFARRILKELQKEAQPQ